MMKMTCKARYNNVSFKVGRKYLSLIKNENCTNERVLERIALNDEIISELENIKECYNACDCHRTIAVMNLFDYIKDSESSYNKAL